MKSNTILNRTKHYLILGLVVWFTMGTTSCKRQKGAEAIQDGIIEGDLFHHPDIGWTVMIPEGWATLTNEELASLQQQGTTAIEDANGLTVDNSGTKMIFGLNKNVTNRLIAAIDNLGDLEMGSDKWEEYFDKSVDVIVSTFDKMELNYTMDESEESINGIPFEIIHVDLKDDYETPLMSMKIYGSVINDLALSVTMIYDNDESQNTLEKMLRESEFKG